MRKIKQGKIALLSVSNKEGLVEFAQTLQRYYEVVSTGGTAKFLAQVGINTTPIEELTNFPESFDERVKSLSSKIAAGILFDRANPRHIKKAGNLGIEPIDIVVCNLYPFESSPGIENIDIGGVTLLRSAAKNFKDVLVVCDPGDYPEVSAAIKIGVTDTLRKKLAKKAFEYTSYYDGIIAQNLKVGPKNNFPEKIIIPAKRVIELRYGENQHQRGVFYAFPSQSSVLPKLKKHGGRDLSFINVTDINAGVEVVRLFRKPAAAVIKHNSPCGIALGHLAEEALSRAISADPESAFGGVVVLNREFNLECSEIIARFKHERKGNMDIVAAPKFNKKALNNLLMVRKSMGIYSFGNIPRIPNPLNLRFADGGFILQTADLNIKKGFKDWEVVTKKKPTQKQLEQMRLAWLFISRIRSNAIVVMDPILPMTRGIGSGQTARVRSVKIALEQAGKFCRGAVLASDSFFPFGDSVELAAKAGIVAIIEEGGSINDQASIGAANRAGIPMIFTHHRAFWH